MCSEQTVRVADVTAAIDEVAASARLATDAATATAMADLPTRLAAIWAMLAQLDPGLAARLPGYARDPDAGS